MVIVQSELIMRYKISLLPLNFHYNIIYLMSIHLERIGSRCKCDDGGDGLIDAESQIGGSLPPSPVAANKLYNYLELGVVDTELGRLVGLRGKAT